MTNLTGFNEEIQQIADVIMQNVSENWQTVYVICEVARETEYCIDSRIVFANKTFHVVFDEAGLDQLKALFRSIRQKSNGAWRMAEFRLTCEGDFNINFEY